MNIVIDRLERTSFSMQQVVDLMHESFQERLEQGLNLLGAFVTLDELEECQAQGGIFVAYSVCGNQNDLLGVGVTTIHDYGKGKYAYNDFDAISSKAKRTGLGSKILQQRILFAKEMGCDFVQSTTAVKATSSVKYHLKNGFKIYKYASFEHRSYYSYWFRIQLNKNSKWNCDIYRILAFVVSFLVVRCTLREDGSLTKLGRIGVRIKPIRSIMGR